MVEKTTSTKIILFCFGIIPRALRKHFFIALAMLFYYVSPRQRFITLHNLKNAFPDRDMAEIIQIAKNTYRHLGIVIAEFFDIPRLTRQDIDNTFEIEGIEYCRAALEKNKGLLLFGAHFGNWELMAVVISLIVHPMLLIYRPLDNPILEDLVKWVRATAGSKTLAKERAMRPMLRTLQKNEIVGLLIDQNVAWQEGIFVDFFGRSACTTDGLAILALHTGAPVIPAFMARQPSGKYRLILGREVSIVDTGDYEKDVAANTQIFMKVIEDMIRKYPDQWLWLHHRWKTKKWQALRQR
ncbi:MAG: lysophospholipid acyltransferase family protein [Deltaproteobacteria bacterium]|nr:lysophospholipid acyltransferase family protein [Deltaproteobacteria bacterium]